MSGFIKLATSDGRVAHIATDQIESFVSRDRFRPGYQAILKLKTGDTLTVEEGVDKIADLITREQHHR